MAMKPQASARATTALVLIAFAAFLVQFDIAAAVVAMPVIAVELSLDLAGFAWVMDAYSLAFVGALMAAGVLADRHGRRRTLVVGAAVFALASLGCVVAPNGAALLVARAAQGVAAAAMICGALALISGLYREPRARAGAFGIVGVITGTAMAFGPAGGGLIAAAFGWRWIFLVNLPICAALVLLLPRVVAESREPEPRPLDIAGMLLLTAGLAGLVAALLHGAAHGWDGTALAGTGAGLLLLAAFVAVERRLAQPMIDLALFAQPAFSGICLVSALMSVSYWAAVVYLPVLAGSVLGLAPAQIGVAMLAATVPMLAMPPLGARLVTQLPRHWFFALGFALNVAGDLVLALAASRADALLAAVGMALTGSGTGLVHSQTSSLAVALVPPARAGMASGIATVVRQGGFALGIAALGMAVANLPLLFACAAATGVVGAVVALVLLRD
jgi:EmrB/QacA subfamily drug resistance transporter